MPDIVPQEVECWGLGELALPGPQDGNPFTEVTLSAEFSFKNRTIEADGFYDGEGIYRVRIMPDAVGPWRYVTRSNRPELDGLSGEFDCISPQPGNHGPVHVARKYHFAYADGTPYMQIGTTCYVWNHQGDALEEQTLATLAQAPFNKIRMCVFPKDYLYNKNEPPHHPFAGSLAEGWDFSRFNPAHFCHLEQRVGDLCKLGIEADIILFHPYDRWGYAAMPAEVDDRYLRYVVARLAPYRNVWWSMANEYDLMKAKDMPDWDRFFRIVQESDPYQHLRSVHNCRGFYDHAKPWVTHCSVQHPDLERVREWRETYGKPVVVDECKYEGNIERGWGNISAREMVHRFWQGTVGGGYVGHGETYVHPQDILWWSKGGTLHGQSPTRIAFLKSILEEAVADGLQGLDPVDRYAVGRAGDYYLYYYGLQQPAFMVYNLPEDARYTIDIIDPWAMTIDRLPGTYTGTTRIELRSQPYLAVRIRRVEL